MIKSKSTVTRKQTENLGLKFIGLDGYLKGMKYFSVFYPPYSSRLYDNAVKLYRNLIEAVLEDCDDSGNLSPSPSLLRKISRFKKKEGIKDLGSEKDLKVDTFCYAPLNEKGVIHPMRREDVRYFNFLEFKKLGSPWILSEEEVRTYSKIPAH